MNKINVQNILLQDCWKTLLREEFQKPYFKDLMKFLEKEFSKGTEIYPPLPMIFNALNSTKFDDTKVVILWQDPYHGPKQAHGLAFSVPRGVAKPPSLKNIFKELNSDLNIPEPEHGDLTSWAKQGVLLLNATLTVQAARAGSHHNKGWEIFTDKIIQTINERKENIVFMLWGSFAQKKGGFIDRSKHFVIESTHPSPLSAYRGFLGSKPFSKTNSYLRENNLKPIDWSIPS